MECFQAVNYSIALMERIAHEHRLGNALSYSDLVEALQKRGLIKNGDAVKLKRLVRLRNLIAHEYTTISNDELEEMYKLLTILKVLTNA